MVIVSALILAGILAQSGTAQAADVLYVSTAGNDANSCLTIAAACRTIVSAVGKASPGDTIIIAAGVYTEGIGIDKTLTLIGFGADATIIDGGFISVFGVTVQIFDLALVNGHNPGGDGGLQNQGGNLSLDYTAILSGYGFNGGGIANFMGTLTLDHSTVSGNEAVKYGGGIYSDGGQVSVSNSNIYSNTTCNDSCTRASPNARTKMPANGFVSSGGGIYSYGALTITNSTISDNITQDGGGGIAGYVSARLTNVTISGNQATRLAGGGIYGAVITLTNVTMAKNSAPSGGSIASPFNSTWLKNTIIANSLAGSNCDGAVVSLGHNLSSDSSCNLNANGDLTNTNLLLGPLQNNGGPTTTHALLPGSPAINHGDNTGCPVTDQRGITRPQAGICDIGAYEYVFPYSMYLPLVMR